MSFIDYYDVLGIRPSAVEIEIEMAFKGRRTQYHPDRYAQSDTETVAWATEKMKEVNEAFAVLTDAGRRSSFDRQRGQSSNSCQSPRPESEPKKPQPSDRAYSSSKTPHIFDYLQLMELAGGDRARLHLHPHIPDKLLTNAIRAREWENRSGVGKILMLLDDTLHGGGKDGLVISEGLVSFKSLFESSNDYFYTGGFSDGFDCHGATVSRKGEECKTFVHVGAPSVAIVCRTINAFVVDLESWHKTEAETGSAVSQMFMSNCNHEDSIAKVKWLTLAAENGHSTGQHNLGCHYQYTNPETAFHWFTLAAAQGVQVSRDRLECEVFAPFRRRSKS